MRQQFSKAVWGAIVALALCTPAVAAPHDAGPSQSSKKLDDALRLEAAGTPAQTVIVTARPGAATDVRKRFSAQGAKVEKDHPLVNAFTVSLDTRGLAAIAADPDVVSVSTDAEVSANAKPAPATDIVVSNLKRMLAIGNAFTGSGVTVAVIDSGIADVADFSGRIAGSYDFTSGKAVARSAADEYGHGTHVAGLIGSSGVSTLGFYSGVAPGARLLSLRVLDKKGTGRTSNVIAALEFAVANRERFNIRVINLSLGHPIYESATTDPLVQAVEAAARSGIVVVTAAGNYGVNPLTGKTGYAGVTSPGNAPSAITVGAAGTRNTVERADDRVASFSSRGPSWFDGYAKPDVVAPGTGLISDVSTGSTLATDFPSLVYPTFTGKLMKLSGSSMATGVVSGLVALMVEAHDAAALDKYNSLPPGHRMRSGPYVPPPALTPNAIKAMLQYSATPLRNDAGVKYDPLTQGAGEIDGAAAITLAYAADTTKPAGTPWMGDITPATQFGADLEAWSQYVIWGTHVVSGPGLMDVNQPAWAQAMTWGSGELDNIVWGTLSAEGDNIVWGTALPLADVVWAGVVTESDNIVWGTALASWGPNIVWGTSIGIAEGDNIVWGTAIAEGDNIVWGTMTDGEGDNIVWGTVELDNIVWGTANKKVLGLVLLGGAQ